MIPRLFALLVVAALSLAGCSHAPPTPQRAASSTAPARASSRAATVPPTAPPARPATEGEDGRIQTLVDQGYYYYARGDFARALQNLESVFLLDPQYPETWARFLLYYCQLATADYKAALRTAEELVKASPNQPLGYLQVGIAELWLGETPAAVLSLQRALDFESHSPRVHFYLGLAQAELKSTAARDKSFKDAEAEYHQILKMNPKDFSANYELAALYLYWNRNVDEASKAIAVAKESILHGADEELPPDRKLFVSYYLPLLEGILLYRKGDPKSSLKALTDSLANAPSGARADLAEIYHYMGRDYLALGDTAGGRTLLDKGLALDPKGPYSADIRSLLKK